MAHNRLSINLSWLVGCKELEVRGGIEKSYLAFLPRYAWLSPFRVSRMLRESREVSQVIWADRPGVPPLFTQIPHILNITLPSAGLLSKTAHANLLWTISNLNPILHYHSLVSLKGTHFVFSGTFVIFIYNSICFVFSFPFIWYVEIYLFLYLLCCFSGWICLINMCVIGTCFY